MADKKTNRIIAFQAEFKNAQEVGKWIAGIEKGIQEAGNKNLDSWVREYQTKLKVLQDNMKKWETEGQPNNIAAAMHAEMRRMLPLSQKIVDTFTKMSLGDNLGEALNQAQKVVDEAEKRQKRHKRNKQSWQRKTADGEKGLSNNEIERIYNSKIAKKGLTVNGKTYGGENGLDAARFVADFKENKEAFYKAASELDIKLKDAIKDREKTITDRIKEETAEMNKAGVELQQALDKLAIAKNQATDNSGEQASSAISGQEAVHNFRAAIEETNDAAKAVREEKTEKEEATKVTEKYNKETKKTPNLVQKAATQVFTYGSVLALFKRALSESKRTITELDQALTDMAIVTDMTREECWKMVDSMQAIAKETGTTTTQVAATTTKFLQQGKSISQATELTKAALMAASIAGIDASRSVDLLTNAMNGFQLSAGQALEVSDKFAALAAASATDYEELAVALSKVAAQANLAGMSMDFTLGMLAKGIEVTREAPETIGTALKTVISRMRELTDYGETLEEGMDVNRVETALENVGVKLRDTNGQFRNLEDVLTELGGKWSTLNINQQANVAVALAGTRQQSRLIAMMQDFDRTLELVDISTNSYGATMAQQMKYMEGLGAATNKLTTAYEGLITNLADSQILINVVNIFSSLITGVSWLVDKQIILMPMLALAVGYGWSVLTNKIKEHKIQKDINKAQEKINILKNKELIASKEERKLDLKAKREGLEQLKLAIDRQEIEEESLKTVLKKLKTEAISRGDMRLAAFYAQEIAKADADDLEQKVMLQNIDQAIAATKAEEAILDQEIKKLNNDNLLLQYKSNVAIGFGQNALGGIVSLLTFIPNILTTILTLKKAGNTEDTKALLLNKKKFADLKKEALAEGGNTGLKIIGAFVQSLGPVGLAIGVAAAAAIVAAVGLGISWSVSAIKSAKEEKAEKNIEGNIKAMQKLQAEMYNLGQQRKLVSGLAEEFDTLSSKINQSSEDISRLEEIIKEFNDSVGSELIVSGTDSTTALQIMQGYESYLDYMLHTKIQQSNATLAKSITSDAKLKSYMNTTGGESIVRQNLAQNYLAFAGASSTTQDLIIQQLKKGSWVKSSGGLDYEAITKSFTESDITLVDEALKSGSLQEYKKILAKLTTEAQNFVINSTSVFNQIKNIDEEVLKQIDALKLNAEQLTKFAPVLVKIIPALSKNDDGTFNTSNIIGTLYKNRMNAFNGLTTQAEIDNAIAFNQEKVNELSANTTLQKLQAKAKEGKLNDKELLQLQDLVTEIGAYENKIEEAKEAQEYLNMSVTEFFNSVGNIKSLTDLQNEINSTRSTLEQLSKLASGELRGSKLDELLDKYPNLIKYIEDGVFTTEELKEAQNELLNTTQSVLDMNLQTVQDKLSTILKEENIMIDLSTATTESVRASIEHLNEETQNEIINAWYEYSTNKMKAKNGIYSDEYWERIGQNTGLVLAKAQYNHYKKELELYSTNDSEYQDKFNQTTNALITVLSDTKINKNKIKSDIDNLVGNYQYKIIDNEIFPIVNGVATALSEIKDKAILDAFSNDMLPQLIEDYTEADNEIMNLAKDLADNYRQEKEKELKQQEEMLEKRKEAYEKYFEDIDALEEEQERRQSKQDIITQLSALTGGVDGTTKSKIKELQSQLNDLMEEEAEAQKEAARNELLEDLDNQTEILNKNMEKLDDSVLVLTRALIGSMLDENTPTFSYNNKSKDSYATQLAAWAKQIGLPGFAQGGLVNYTGLAMVHGSPNKPEAFLSADETLLISAFVDNIMNLLDSVDKTSNSDIVDNFNNSVNIENITIKTDHLNNNQDFKTAGTTLAEEFAAVIRERGLNINVRK